MEDHRENGGRPHLAWLGDPDTGIPFELTEGQKKDFLEAMKEAEAKVVYPSSIVLYFGTGGHDTKEKENL